MTAPQTGAVRFGYACLMGAALGLFYGFLRPLRPKYTLPADLLFLAAVFSGWVYWGFGICRGDLRPAGFPGMLLGGLLWENTAGRLLRPVVRGFWKILGKIRSYLLWPAKKISDSVKILIASAKKWVTIGWNIRRHRRESGGDKHDHRQQEV